MAPRNKGFAVHARREDRLMNQGFTLIELVVVISIVAITVALVLPRVWYWQRQARIGQLSYARGAVHSSATLVHGALLAAAACPTPRPAQRGIADNRTEGRGTVCTEHGLVQTRNGYPASIPPGTPGAPGILGAAGIGAAFNATAPSFAPKATTFMSTTASPRFHAPMRQSPRSALHLHRVLVARMAASISVQCDRRMLSLSHPIFRSPPKENLHEIATWFLRSSSWSWSSSSSACSLRWRCPSSSTSR